ncbi:hypothetical protein OQH60_06225 [Campylobacter sp. MIT 21-1685]|uniref:hypothetical protein n=1 Tax=unclassified Campylobacter TaxID=2593542 RepID=UPI00224AECAE|nr:MULTISPECIES: hypothetical protein [unclassified Campylobacter]MCX2683437.1 hypothetical protein [Campylobacter sp. MIT 21-1684]MCX2751742.1 hypothetical protein [Campylobacter sp. MIT 21-1682]MCX2807943.1 hypothetical protein [Campylobacter sp. MIT 21-1685]
MEHEANPRDKVQGFENIFGKNGSENLGTQTFLYYFNKQNHTTSDMRNYIKATPEEIFD